MHQEIKLLSIDLAKDVFQLYGIDSRGRNLLKKKVKRHELLSLTAQLPACKIAMEACGGSHYWSRQFRSQGHEPLIMASQFVKPYKRTRQKNDVHDAEAISEAAQRPNMRFVGIKSLTSQDLQSAHRVRQQMVKQRTALINQCRGIAMEYGVTLPQGRHNFNKHFYLVLEEWSELTLVARDLLLSQKTLIDNLDKQIDETEKKIEQLGRQNADYERLLSVPGVGPLTASMFLGSVGDVSVFKNGRHLAAWLGLVPRQHSSGGHTRLMSITKAGDADLRAVLIHGARALIQATLRKQGDDPQSQWILNLLKKKGWNITAVAIANRNCRVIWHLLKYKEEFKKTA